MAEPCALADLDNVWWCRACGHSAIVHDLDRVCGVCWPRHAQPAPAGSSKPEAGIVTR